VCHHGATGAVSDPKRKWNTLMADQYTSRRRSANKARARWGVLLLAAVTGCAGRAPQPVAVVQPQDRYADCAAIFAQVQANNAKISDLSSE